MSDPSYNPLHSSSYDALSRADDRDATLARERENDEAVEAGAVLVPCPCTRGCYECRGTLLVPRRALRWDDGGASDKADAAQVRLPW